MTSHTVHGVVGEHYGHVLGGDVLWCFGAVVVPVVCSSEGRPEYSRDAMTTVWVLLEYLWRYPAVREPALSAQACSDSRNQFQLLYSGPGLGVHRMLGSFAPRTP